MFFTIRKELACGLQNEESPSFVAGFFVSSAVTLAFDGDRMKRAICVLALLVACNEQTPAPKPLDTPPPAPAPAGAESSIPRVTPADLQARLGAVTVIDVRHADNYAFAHIPGAMHIPLSSIEQEAPYLPKDKPIVTYCT